MKNRTDKLISLGESFAPKYDEQDAKFLSIAEKENHKILISEYLNDIQKFSENSHSDLGVLTAELAVIVQKIKKNG